MLVTMSGDRGGEPWPPEGGMLGVGPEEATELERAGIAKVAEPEDEGE